MEVQFKLDMVRVKLAMELKIKDMQLTQKQVHTIITCTYIYSENPSVQERHEAVLRGKTDELEVKTRELEEKEREIEVCENRKWNMCIMNIIVSIGKKCTVDT